MKTAIAALAALSLAGCAALNNGISNTIIGPDGVEIEDNYSGNDCHVDLYMSRAQAEAGGPIQTLCLITGNLSMTFDKSIIGNINRHKMKACSCGARKVYIHHADVDGIGLIAFRYR